MQKMWFLKYIKDVWPKYMKMKKVQTKNKFMDVRLIVQIDTSKNSEKTKNNYLLIQL